MTSFLWFESRGSAKTRGGDPEHVPGFCVEIEETQAVQL